MTLSVQIIEREGEPEYAVIPFREFERLRALAQKAEELRAFDSAIADTSEALPHEVVARLVAGESPLRVLREHRRLTQAALAELVAIDKTYLSHMEAGRKSGSVAVLKRLAAALSVEVDDLLPD